MSSVYIHHWIAIFFLLFVCTDINCPQVCCEELGKLPQASYAQLSATGQAGSGRHALLTNDSRQQEQPDTDSGDDDCMCCGHVLAGTVVSQLLILDLISPFIKFENDLLLSPPLESAFHPPRFA